MADRKQTPCGSKPLVEVVKVAGKASDMTIERGSDP
jgi:hypothetical protein